MQWLMHIALSNAALASVAALLAWVAGRLARKPALTHALWVIVLLKLITPPLWSVPLQWPVEKDGRSAVSAPVPQPIDLPRPRAADAVGSALADASAVGGQTASAKADPTRIDLDAEPRDAESDARSAESTEVPEETIASNVPTIMPTPRVIAASSTAIDWAHWAWIIGATIWATGAIVSVGVSVARISQFRRGLRFALPADTACQRRAEVLSRRLGLRSAPRIEFVPGAVCPMLWSASISPRVLIPSGLWERLDLAQRDTLLLHELAHLRRRDHWVRWLELLVTALYWWLPIVWWARHQMREAEEQCCDAWVLWAMPDSFRQYASALLEAVDFVSIRRSVPLLASGMGQFGHLRRRLTMLKQGDVARAMSWTGFFASCGAGALLLSIAPTFAQSVSSDSKTEKTSTTPIVTGSADQAAPTEAAPSAAPAEKSDVKRATEAAPASAAPASPAPPTPAAAPVGVTTPPLFTPSEDAAPASPSPSSSASRQMKISALPHVATRVEINNNKDAEFRTELSVIKSDEDGQYVVIGKGAQDGKDSKEANDELMQARRQVQDLNRQMQDLNRKMQQAGQHLKQLELAHAKMQADQNKFNLDQKKFDIDPKKFDIDMRDGKIVTVRPKSDKAPAAEATPKADNFYADVKDARDQARKQADQMRKEADQARANADRERRLANVERQLSQLLDEVKRLHNDSSDDSSNRSSRGGKQGS